MYSVSKNLELYLQNYDKWFFQYIDCSIEDDFLIKISDIPITNTNYHLEIIEQGIVNLYFANKHFSLPSFCIALHGLNCNVEYCDNCWHHWGSYLKEGAGQIKVWLSSVPYDLLGTGI